QKIHALERYVNEGRAQLAAALAETPSVDRDRSASLSVAAEAALLDADHLAAIKLALKTKRLPFTPDDERVRHDESRPLHERFSSGLSEIPLSEYYKPYAAEADFTRETLRTVEFLIANRRAFKERSEEGINDARHVDEFVRLCQEESLLRSLFVFTCADRA